jgi:hypothetical protein
MRPTRRAERAAIPLARKTHRFACGMAICRMRVRGRIYGYRVDGPWGIRRAGHPNSISPPRCTIAPLRGASSAGRVPRFHTRCSRFAPGSRRRRPPESTDPARPTPRSGWSRHRRGWREEGTAAAGRPWSRTVVLRAAREGHDGAPSADSRPELSAARFSWLRVRTVLRHLNGPRAWTAGSSGCRFTLARRRTIGAGPARVSPTTGVYNTHVVFAPRPAVHGVVVAADVAREFPGHGRETMHPGRARGHSSDVVYNHHAAMAITSGRPDCRCGGRSTTPLRTGSRPAARAVSGLHRCGNTLKHAVPPHVLLLMMDRRSGICFGSRTCSSTGSDSSLASALARELLLGGPPVVVLFDLIQQDPVLSRRLKLIAVPWGRWRRRISGSAIFPPGCWTEVERPGIATPC